MDIAEIFANNLRQLRKERDWTQAQLAEKSRMDHNSVRAYENLRRWPGLAYIKAIAKAFGVTEDALFRSPEDPVIQSLVETIGSLNNEIAELRTELETYRVLPEGFVQIWNKASEARKASCLVILGASKKLITKRETS